MVGLDIQVLPALFLTLLHPCLHVLRYSLESDIIIEHLAVLHGGGGARLLLVKFSRLDAGFMDASVREIFLQVLWQSLFLFQSQLLRRATLYHGYRGIQVLCGVRTGILHNLPIEEALEYFDSLLLAFLKVLIWLHPLWQLARLTQLGIGGQEPHVDVWEELQVLHLLNLYLLALVDQLCVAVLVLQNRPGGLFYAFSHYIRRL
jgi:hypothetical protein